MNIKHRPLTLLIALVMVLTFYACVSFADSEPLDEDEVSTASRNYCATPVSAEFFPADGFVGYSEIGEKTLYSENLYGRGNKIVVNYDDNTVKEYIYHNYEDEWGFYYTNKAGEKEYLEPEIALDRRCPKGENTVSGMLYFVDPDYTAYKFPVLVTVKATHYYTEVPFKSYLYTGKKITPKIVVKYWNGKTMKTMPPSWYTCKPKKNAKVGSYEYRVTINKKYHKKYGTALVGSYEIIPKKPTIKSVAAGKGQLTVKWAKFSSKDQKGIGGFIIECSSDKKFRDIYDTFRVKKSAAKATIKHLDSGKTYYVRVRTYEKGKWFYSPKEFLSKPSKVLKTKIK